MAQTLDPLVLYKYRAYSERTLDIIRSSRMWFANGADLNDTFEFSVPMLLSLAPEAIVQHYLHSFAVDQLAPRVLDALMAASGGTSFEVSPGLLRTWETQSNEPKSLLYIAVAHYLADKGLSHQDIASHLGLHAESALTRELELELRDAYSRNLGAGQHIGVLSLSARYDDPLMWAHYAESCQGLCIGISLDIDRAIDARLIPLWIEYTDELTNLQPTAFFDRSHEHVIDMLRLFYGTKHVSWRHEHEFRLLAPQSNVLYDVPGHITDVILGEKMTADCIGAVLEALRDSPNIRVSKMMRHPGSWRYQRYILALH